jgi:hypothetical protein
VTASYRQLAALAETERDLAVAGGIEELRAVQGRRDAIVASLPAQAPRAAEPYLRRAAAAQAQVTAALAAAAGDAAAEVVRLEHGRTVVSAYRSSLADPRR